MENLSDRICPKRLFGEETFQRERRTKSSLKADLQLVSAARAITYKLKALIGKLISHITAFTLKPFGERSNLQIKL